MSWKRGVRKHSLFRPRDRPSVASLGLGDGAGPGRPGREGLVETMSEAATNRAGPSPLRNLRPRAARTARCAPCRRCPDSGALGPAVRSLNPRASWCASPSRDHILSLGSLGENSNGPGVFMTPPGRWPSMTVAVPTSSFTKTSRSAGAPIPGGNADARRIPMPNSIRSPRRKPPGYSRTGPSREGPIPLPKGAQLLHQRTTA